MPGRVAGYATCPDSDLPAEHQCPRWLRHHPWAGLNHCVVIRTPRAGLLVACCQDGPSGEEWEVFAECSCMLACFMSHFVALRYDGSEIILPFKERGGSKAVGKWFSNKKLGVKGIKSFP